MEKIIIMGLMMGIITTAAISTILGVSVQSVSATADRCITQRQGESTGTLCGLDKDEAKDMKQQCRELKDEGVKCSSSQTGHGDFGNFEK